MGLLQSIESWDVSVLYWIQENLRFAALTPVMKCITSLGNAGIFWIILSLILLIPKRTRKAGLVSLISMAICFLIVHVGLKSAVARIRPYDAYPQLKRLIAPQKDFSFPSGHTVNAFASSLILVRMLPKKAGIPLVILAAVIAYSRLYVGVHYPSDVIAGFLIALIVSWIVWTVYKYMERKREEKYEAAGGAAR